jgi:3-deoxy-D-manno-octulosonate 8-phosphate phosphatase (KDO 8-P phosphatase)
MNLANACSKIELILSDVDGVMTDGGIHILDDGTQLVKFHIRDGMGVRLWREAGKRFGIVTGRKLESIRKRAEDLWLDIIRLGIDDKLPAVDELAAEFNITREQVCYIGDDLLDLKTIQSVGLGVAVADAVEDVRKAAKYTTSVPGGQAAVREVIELILKNTGRWDDVLNRYSAVA